MNSFVHLAKTDRAAFNKVRGGLHRESKEFPNHLIRCPDLETEGRNGILEIWRSRHFLATIYDQGGVIRISVNRSAVKNNGHWKEGISWDDLMRIKREIGRADQYAVELFPSDRDLVDVANIRHLFLVERPDFAWADRSEEGDEFK